jgi:hypothetical protein
MLNDLQKMAAQAAIKKMLHDRYFSILHIDTILTMTNGKPNRDDYNILRTLHCVDYGDMAPELLRGLPVLIERVLTSEPLQTISLDFADSTKKLMHEIYGIIKQETSEYEEAIHKRLTDDEKVEELKDIAVAALFGIASIRTGGVDW